MKIFFIAMANLLTGFFLLINIFNTHPSGYLGMSNMDIFMIYMGIGMIVWSGLYIGIKIVFSCVKALAVLF